MITLVGSLVASTINEPVFFMKKGVMFYGYRYEAWRQRGRHSKIGGSFQDMGMDVGSQTVWAAAFWVWWGTP